MTRVRAAAHDTPRQGHAERRGRAEAGGPPRRGDCRPGVLGPRPGAGAGPRAGSAWGCGKGCHPTLPPALCRGSTGPDPADLRAHDTGPKLWSAASTATSFPSGGACCPCVSGHMRLAVACGFHAAQSPGPLHSSVPPTMGEEAPFSASLPTPLHRGTEAPDGPSKAATALGPLARVCPASPPARLMCPHLALPSSHLPRSRQGSPHQEPLAGNPWGPAGCTDDS